MENLKSKAGVIFSIARPAFKLGVINLNQTAEKLPKNIRNGLGNYDIERRNFEASEIIPRIAGDFDKLQAIDIETQGAKIQLSEKTIAELFKTKIDDKTDNQWLDEKNRLIAVYQARGMTASEIEKELEVNKPLGREQRKITSNQNIGQSSLSVKDKLQEIKQEVEDGRAESRAQQALLIGQLGLIFRDTQAIENFTTLQLTDLAQTVARLNLPRSAKQLGLQPRYIDIDFYTKNEGLINLFLFANVSSDPNYGIPNGISYSSPVYSFNQHPLTGMPCIKFESLITGLRRPANRLYLDLEKRGTLNNVQMTAITNGLANGWDNPEVSVLPINR